jgi:hypothetical protein
MFDPSSLQSKRIASTAFAPVSRAASRSRSTACRRLSESIFV